MTATTVTATTVTATTVPAAMAASAMASSGSVVMSKMSIAKALSVEIVSPIVGTFVTSSVVIAGASYEQQGYRRGADDQKFFCWLHRPLLTVF